MCDQFRCKLVFNLKQGFGKKTVNYVLESNLVALSHSSHRWQSLNLFHDILIRTIKACTVQFKKNHHDQIPILLLPLTKG